MGIEVGKIDIKTKCLPNQNSVSQIFIGDGHQFKFSFSRRCVPGPGNSDIKLSNESESKTDGSPTGPGTVMPVCSEVFQVVV